MKYIIKKFLFTCIVLLICNYALKSQNKYWVFFTDKQGVTFDPYTYFDQKAIERRLQHNITLYDSSDFPLNEDYVKKLMSYADSLSQESRWFNAVAVYVCPEQIENISRLPFVHSVEPITSNCMIASADEAKRNLKIDEDLLKKQLDRMQGAQFTNNQLNGKGIRIAVFDAGFPSVNTHEAFEHIRAGNRIIKTWDFVKKREYVYDYSSHGTMTLSCIAGIYKDIPIGLATEAEFLLARTEMSAREPFSEEQNWLAAAEWADKNGAHIISSSLGYVKERYFPKDMNGKKSLVTRAANMAASKGMLVVNSAGNEGTSVWKIIGAPADADSVLSIGGYDPYSDYHISFPSYGPTADKRLKPNVCAFGTAFVADKASFTTADGTSFSCPLVAGFAACAWQSNRSLSNMQLFKELEKSADLYPYFDYAHGYGIPQADYFINKGTQLNEEKFSTEVNDNVLEVKINNFIETDILSDENYKEKLLFYNIQKPDGTLHKYYVISVYSEKPLTIDLSNIEKGNRINISYEGYFKTYQN